MDVFPHHNIIVILFLNNVKILSSYYTITVLSITNYVDICV